MFQLDPHVARLLNEEELSKYIMRYANRVYAKNWTELNAEEHGNEDRLQKLIQRLREKIKLRAIPHEKKNMDMPIRMLKARQGKLNLAGRTTKIVATNKLEDPKEVEHEKLSLKKMTLYEIFWISWENFSPQGE